MQINVWAVQTHRPVALGDQQTAFPSQFAGRQCAARPGEGRPASGISDMSTHFGPLSPTMLLQQNRD
jgi:hypothetical protein